MAVLDQASEWSSRQLPVERIVVVKLLGDQGKSPQSTPPRNLGTVQPAPQMTLQSTVGCSCHCSLSRSPESPSPDAEVMPHLRPEVASAQI